MATAEAETSRDERAAPGGWVYDGFISYSHAADDLLAPRLQAGLQRFAKPWWKRRALRIFRDESSLSANPHLWSSITDALDGSGWFVLLLSPDAAQSPWVNNEVEYWLEHRDPERIIPVLTDGTFGWSNGDVTGDAVPDALQGVLADEPRWVDLRFARSEEQLDLSNPQFSDAVADVASAIHGVPKDELASEEVRQHRRTRRTAWAAGAGLTILALLAGGAALFALDQRNQAQAQQATAEAAAEGEAEARQAADENAAVADTQRRAAEEAEALALSRELAASSVNALDSDPELATLLALEAIAATPEGADQPLEVVNALWQAGGANRLVDVIETGHESLIDLSADGTTLIATTAPTEVSGLDPSTGTVRWSYSEDTVDFFAHPIAGPDGRIAQTIIDSTAQAASSFQEEEDTLPNRVVILDGATGERIHTLEFSDCVGIDTAAWSADGAYLAVGSGQNGCIRNDALHWLELFDTATWESIAFLAIESFAAGPVPRFDASGRLYALVSFGPIVTFEPPLFDSPAISAATGIGDVTADGSRLVLFYSDEEGGTPFSARTFDGESGEVIDILYTGDSHPVAPYGVEISADGQTAFVGTTGGTTSVFDLTAGVERLRLPTGSIDTLSYDPQTDRLYTSAPDGSIKVWDLSASTVGVDSLGDLGTHSWVNGNSFSLGPGSGVFEAIDVNTGEWVARFFDPDTGELRDELLSDVFGPTALANGRFVAGQQTRTERVLVDPLSGNQIELLPCEVPGLLESGDPICVGEDEPDFYEVKVSVDGNELLAFARDVDDRGPSAVVELDPESGAPIGGFSLEETDPEFDVFTDEWGFGYDITGLGAIDRHTGNRLYSGEWGEPLEPSPSGELIAFARAQTDLVIIDTTTWDEVLAVGGSTRIRGLGFDEREERIAVGTLDSMFIVDLESGVIVQQMRLPGVSDVYWLDDETVLVGTNDGRFGTVSLSTHALLDRTRAALRRTFTDQECLTYRIDPCPSLAEMTGS